MAAALQMTRFHGKPRRQCYGVPSAPAYVDFVALRGLYALIPIPQETQTRTRSHVVSGMVLPMEVPSAAVSRSVTRQTSRTRPKPRTRSTRACRRCRLRKVRCNAGVSGPPCSNCSLDRAECIFSEGNSLPSHGNQEDQESSMLLGAIGTSKNLPFWIQPPTISDLDPSELDALLRCYCYYVPSVECLKEVLDAYSEYVHPTMPLLDVDELHSTMTVRPTVAGVAKGKRVSLLLAQALLFAASPFLMDSTLQTLGYDSGAVAQRAFYQRAELLYSHNTEKDPVALLQSLLLMSYRVRTPDNEKSAIYWSRLAATYAQTTDIAGIIKRSPEGRYRSLLRRLWWCCLLRESLVGIGSRLPTILYTDSESPSPLTAEDFPSSTDINLYSTCAPQSNGGDVANNGGVDRSQERNDIGTIQVTTIELSRLSVWMSKLLSIDRSTTALAGLAPCISGQEDQKIDCWRRLAEKTCATGLKEWFDALPAEARFSTAEVTGSTPSASVTAHRIMLYMVFQAAASYLYRRQTVHAASIRDSPIACSPKDPLRHAARRLRRAAQEIASASKIMIGQDLTKYMQPHGVSVMLSAMSVLLVDVRDRSKAANAAVAVRSCLAVLQAMARNHDGVQRVYEAFAQAFTPLIEHPLAQIQPREHDEGLVHGNDNGEASHLPFSATPVPDTQMLDFHDPWNVGWPWDSFQPGEINHQSEALLGYDISVRSSNPGQSFENMLDSWFPDDVAEGNLLGHDEFLF